MSRSGYGSDRYGPCDICGKRADSVYYQQEERLYWNPIFWRYSWTGEGCEDHMGHRECLEKIRKKKIIKNIYSFFSPLLSLFIVLFKKKKLSKIPFINFHNPHKGNFKSIREN